MRFSTAAALALPVLATAQDNPFDSVKNFLSKWAPKIQHPHAAPIPAVAAKAGGKTVQALSLYDWEDKVRGSLKPDAADSDSANWWVLVTGGNKSCFGHCGPVSKAFNETAALWSLDPAAPNLGYIDCDLQPVLCNSWGAGAPSLWVFEVHPPTVQSNIWITGFNISTTNVTTFTHLRKTEAYKKNPPYEGYFHPLDGLLAKLYIAKPLGYVFWAFTILPNWLFMILISFASRSIMGNRINPAPPPRTAAPAPAAARVPAGGVKR